MSRLPLMPLLRTVFVVLAFAAPFTTPLAQAGQVYKWTDDRGVVNYSTTPPSARKSTPVDVAPAATAVGEARSTGEAEYWRARSQREAASELTLERVRRETEELRQVKLRQEIVAAETAAREKSAAQLARDQCRSERRVDCDSNRAGVAASMQLAYPVVVVVRRPAAVSTTPYFSVTSNFTPGFSKPLVYSTR